MSAICSLSRERKTMISSMRLTNSGRRVFLRIFIMSSSRSSNDSSRLEWARIRSLPRLEVMMMTVCLKSTVRPCESVRRLTYRERNLIEDKVDGVTMDIETSLASQQSKRSPATSRASCSPHTTPTPPSAWPTGRLCSAPSPETSYRTLEPHSQWLRRGATRERTGDSKHGFFRRSCIQMTWTQRRSRVQVQGRSY